MTYYKGHTTKARGADAGTTPQGSVSVHLHSVLARGLFPALKVEKPFHVRRGGGCRYLAGPAPSGTRGAGGGLGLIFPPPSKSLRRPRRCERRISAVLCEARCLQSEAFGVLTVFSCICDLIEFQTPGDPLDAAGPSRGASLQGRGSRLCLHLLLVRLLDRPQWRGPGGRPCPPARGGAGRKLGGLGSSPRSAQLGEG